MKWAASILLCVLAFLAALASAQGTDELQTKLRQTIGGKLLSLRIPCADSVLEFDAQGNLRNKSGVRPWTIKSVLRVKNLLLTSHSLEIDGERVFLAWDISKDDGFLPVATGQKVHVMIGLTPPLSDAQANKTLLAIFEPDDLKNRFAEYWKPLAVPKMEQQVGKNKIARIFGELDGQDVYGVSPGLVTPPRVIEGFEPKFPEGLKQPRDHVLVLLVVIDEAGFPAIVQVAKSIGTEFDIAGMYAASEWRFHPALRNGKPVAVATHIEVNFQK